ncbi:MAG: ATPase, T2SS/T4P/T4SS family [Acidimicrobiaceae bacterium]|nr:ATPase, T2SS/T4P/T4SS family [Acidimicrobiaceae bacterium]MCY3950304.1 ATPase, T2SS/T4P/T4SS family [Acidimicrobiaceae bacterium]
MLLVLCDDALGTAARDWVRDALRSGLSAVAGHVWLADDVVSMPRPDGTGEPCVAWLTSSAELDAIAAAAAAASEVVLLLGAPTARAATPAADGTHAPQAWRAAASSGARRIAVWLPTAGGGRGDPTGELSAALGVNRIVRIKRVGARSSYRQLHRLGRSLASSACAPQRLDRSDGDIRRRTAARAATDALSELLDEPDVEEFQIRGGESMLVQCADGRVERRPSPFAADADLIEAVRFLASYSGDRPQRFDELDPRLDVRIGDRWRLHAEAFVTTPPNVVLRSNMAGRMRLDDLGLVSDELGSVLIEAIAGRVRANVVVAAAMGGGKTTLCQALLAAVPDHERIDTIEDTPELRLAEYGIHPNTYERLTRDPNQDGHGRHSMADHIRDAKRANAAKLVVGEIRGEGCEALLDAMSSGLDGCLVTLHSQPGKGVLEKLVAYACSEGAEPDYARRQIAAAVDLCVWMGRNDAGERVVADVTQLTGIDDLTGVISTTCLWALRPGDRWASPVGRPAGRVAEVYASAGLPEAGGVAELPTAYSQIVDVPVVPSLDAPLPALAYAAPPGEAAQPAIAPRADVAPPAIAQSAGAPRPPRPAPPTEDTESAVLTDPIASQRDSRSHDAAPCDAATRGGVLWDPGPLVPVDDPPPYEPLVGEEASC